MEIIANFKLIGERCYVKHEWTHILHTFSKATKEKKYERISHDIWTRLTKGELTKVSLFLDDLGIPSIEVYVDKTKDSLTFAINDKKIGAFLFNETFTREEQRLCVASNVPTQLTGCTSTIKAITENVIVVSNDDWLEKTDKFYDKVIDGKCAELSENARDVLCEYSASVYLTFTKDVITVQTCHTEIPLCFSINDWGFGQFLYEEFFNKPMLNCETAKTAYLTNTISDQISYISSTSADIGTSNKLISNCAITSLDEEIKKLKAIVETKEKENKTMKNFNFDFGPCTHDNVRMSMYGIAVKNAAGVYVSYNHNTNEIIDVDILNFDGAKFLYKIPVALKDVAVGDIIIHNRKPMFVTCIDENNHVLICVDVYEGEQKQVIPTVNMFGFNFVTKIVSLFNTLGENAPSTDAPFGNMLPLMMLNDGEDIDPMMLMFMMGGKLDMNNPMMLYFLLKDRGNDNLLPLMFMMNGNK